MPASAIHSAARIRDYRSLVLSMGPTHYWPLDNDAGGLDDQISGLPGIRHANTAIDGGVSRAIRGHLRNTMVVGGTGFSGGFTSTSEILLNWQSTYTLAVWCMLDVTASVGGSVWTIGSPSSLLYPHSGNGAFTTYREASPSIGWGSASSFRGVWSLLCMQSVWNSGTGQATYTFRRRRIGDAAVAVTSSTNTVGGTSISGLYVGTAGHGTTKLDRFAHQIYWDRAIADQEFDALYEAGRRGLLGVV